MAKPTINERLDDLKETLYSMRPDVEQLRVAMIDLVWIVSKMHREAEVTANTASCLANGIKPD